MTLVVAIAALPALALLLALAVRIERLVTPRRGAATGPAPTAAP